MINEYHYTYKTTCKVRRSSHEEIPHIQGQRKPSKTVGTGAAVRRYPVFKGKGAAPARR